MTFKIASMDPFGKLIEPNQTQSSIYDLDIKKLREILYNNHLLILRGFQQFLTANELSKYCENWGEIGLWPFGKVLELKAQKQPQDHIFDSNYVPLHWDGMYREQVPELQIFQCVAAPLDSHGGQTTFSNTKIALENTPHPTMKALKQVTGHYQRKMEFYNSKTACPIICNHPTRNYEVIRFCEPPKTTDREFLNPAEIHFEEQEGAKKSDLLQTLDSILYSSKNFYAHTWQTGDIVIADNHTLLHGRNSFTSSSPRHIRRVHILGETPLNNPHLVSSI